MRRFLLRASPLGAMGLALLPATAQARACSEVLVLGTVFQEQVQTGPSGPPTFDWKVTSRNVTPTRQVMRIWLHGINNVTNPVDAARRQMISPSGQIAVTLGRISGTQPSVQQMQAAIRTTCEG
jgi:hypothetical protein